MGRLGYDPLRRGRQRLGHVGVDAARAPTRPSGSPASTSCRRSPPPDPATFDDLTAGERAALDDLADAERWESGYAAAAGDATADARVRARRLAGGPVRLDRREAAGVDRQRRPSRRRHPPRPHPRRGHALLADQHGHVVGPPLPRELRHRAGVVHRRRAHAGRRAHGVLDLPEGDAPAVPALGRPPLPRHPPLARARPRRALRRPGTDRRRSSTSCAPSSAWCAEAAATVAPGTAAGPRPGQPGSTRARTASRRARPPLGESARGRSATAGAPTAAPGRCP